MLLFLRIQRSWARSCGALSSTLTLTPRFRRTVMLPNIPRLFTTFTVSLIAVPLLFGQTESAIKNVFWQPNELQPGSVIFLTVELNNEASRVSGHFLGKN